MIIYIYCSLTTITTITATITTTNRVTIITQINTINMLRHSLYICRLTTCAYLLSELVIVCDVDLALYKYRAAMYNRTNNR